MAPHSSTLAWKIPRTEEPGRLQSMESLRVGHNWATSLSLFTFLHWRRKWQPTPVFLPGESHGQRSLAAPIHRITKSWTQLKWLSMHAPIIIITTVVIVWLFFSLPLLLLSHYLIWTLCTFIGSNKIYSIGGIQTPRGEMLRACTMRWTGGQFFFRFLENEAEEGACGPLNGSLTGKKDF